MLKTIEASIDKDGNVHLKESVKLKNSRKALVTILDEDDSVNEITLVSQDALSKDWNNPDEDKAWAHLQ
ncbi:MAG TPA: hypothetical protein PKE39_06835 [Ignavibacteria bacterium]|nr:hypothetical protein [Ignavibacteria bacterium]HMQ98725.1 hypothetical protein [Ignavibacteria bacterium]